MTITHAPDAPLTQSKPDAELELKPRIFSDEEATEKLCAYHGWDAHDLHDGRHRRRLNHELDMYRYHVRKAFATGELNGLEHRASIAAALWPEEISSREVLNRKKPQMRSWGRALEGAGLLELRDARGQRGIRWRLLDGRRRYAEPLSRGYSSVGRAAGGALHRRRESRSERRQRRVRPYCRRVGNQTSHQAERSVGRLAPARHRSSHFAKKFSPSGMEGLRPLKGPPPSPSSQGLHAGNGPGVDAPGGRPPDVRSPIQLISRSAARKQEQRLRFEGGVSEIERLLVSESPGALPLAQREALLAALGWLQRALDRRGRQLDRPIADDLALQLLARCVSSACADRRQRSLPPIRSLGWFVPVLRSHARRTEDVNRRRALEPYVRMLRRLLAIDVARNPEHPNPRPAERELLRCCVEREPSVLLDPDLATVARELLQRPRRGSGVRYTGR